MTSFNERRAAFKKLDDAVAVCAELGIIPSWRDRAFNAGLLIGFFFGAFTSLLLVLYTIVERIQ